MYLYSSSFVQYFLLVTSKIPIKLPKVFFTELEWKMLQVVWKHKRLWLAKALLRKKKEKKKLEESTFFTSDYTTKPQ